MQLLEAGYKYNKNTNTFVLPGEKPTKPLTVLTKEEPPGGHSVQNAALDNKVKLMTLNESRDGSSTQTLDNHVTEGSSLQGAAPSDQNSGVSGGPKPRQMHVNVTTCTSQCQQPTSTNTHQSKPPATNHCVSGSRGLVISQGEEPALQTATVSKTSQVGSSSGHLQETVITQEQKLGLSESKTSASKEVRVSHSNSYQQETSLVSEVEKPGTLKSETPPVLNKVDVSNSSHHEDARPTLQGKKLGSKTAGQQRQKEHLEVDKTSGAQPMEHHGNKVVVKQSKINKSQKKIISQNIHTVQVQHTGGSIANQASTNMARNEITTQNLSTIQKDQIASKLSPGKLPQAVAMDTSHGISPSISNQTGKSQMSSSTPQSLPEIAADDVSRILGGITHDGFLSIQTGMSGQENGHSGSSNVAQILLSPVSGSLSSPRSSIMLLPSPQGHMTTVTGKNSGSSSKPVSSAGAMSTVVPSPNPPLGGNLTSGIIKGKPKAMATGMMGHSNPQQQQYLHPSYVQSGVHSPFYQQLGQNNSVSNQSAQVVKTSQGSLVVVQQVNKQDPKPASPPVSALIHPRPPPVQRLQPMQVVSEIW